MDNQVTRTSATIIDFNAYKRNKHAAAKLSSGQVCATASNDALTSYYFFWLSLAWVPFGMMCLPASERHSS